MFTRMVSCALLGSKRYAHTQANTLKAVAMLMRHGDRAPSFKYPNDPHKTYEWPGGLGALSPKGKIQMIHAGKIKSSRYSSLISLENGIRKFDNISVLSSAVERCIDTAYCFLEGFLDGTHWPRNIVQSKPLEEDEFLCIRGKPCPAYEKALLQECAVQHPHVVDFIKSIGLNQEIFKLLEKKIGMPLESVMHLLFLEDILLVQRDNGLTLPDWVTPLYKDCIRPIADFTCEKIMTSKVSQHRSGALLKDMIQRLDDNINGHSKKDIVVYSAHDLTICSLMCKMKIFDQIDCRIAYGSCFAMELHRETESAFGSKVKLFYFRDYADENPIEIVPPAWMHYDSFEKFKKSLEPKFTKDYESQSTHATGIIN